MELQLQELLDRIKREGVEAARAEAERIVAEAQDRARELQEEAARAAAAVREQAVADAARAEEAGRAALEQASRNLLLAFRDGVQARLDALVRAEVQAAYGPEVVAEAIPAVLGALSQGGAEDLAVLVPAPLLKRLEDRYSSVLAAVLKKGIEVSASSQPGAGFRVTEKAGSAYYDFSATAVADILSAHLNARLAEILKGAARSM